jgi:hypothetical protein
VWTICADQMLLFMRMKPNLKYIGMIKQKATISPNFFLKVSINTITWIWTKSLIIHTVTFRGIVNVEKIYCHFFSCDFVFYRRNTYMVAFCFIIPIYFKFGFILINNNIWSAHIVHTYYLITRTNINLIFELCNLLTGKQIGTPQLHKAQVCISPIISLIFPFLSISHFLNILFSDKDQRSN